MQKIGKTLLVLVAVLALGFYIWNSNRQQQAMRQNLEEQIASLAKQQSGQPGTNPAGTDAPLAHKVNATRPDTELARLSQTNEVYTQGWKLLESQKPEPARQAAQIFREALANIDPQNPQFYNGLARALLVSNQPRDAIYTWRQGIALGQKLPADQLGEFYSGIGWGYWNLHDYARARQSFEAALKLNPKSIDAWANVAWVELALGHYDRARDGFVILFAYDKKNPAWGAGIGMARAHNSNLEQIGQYQKLPPLEAFDHPLPVDPADPATTTPASVVPTPSTAPTN